MLFLGRSPSRSAPSPYGPRNANSSSRSPEEPSPFQATPWSSSDTRKDVNRFTSGGNGGKDLLVSASLPSPSRSPSQQPQSYMERFLMADDAEVERMIAAAQRQHRAASSSVAATRHGSLLPDTSTDDDEDSFFDGEGQEGYADNGSGFSSSFSSTESRSEGSPAVSDSSAAADALATISATSNRSSSSNSSSGAASTVAGSLQDEINIIEARIDALRVAKEREIELYLRDEHAVVAVEAIAVRRPVVTAAPAAQATRSTRVLQPPPPFQSAAPSSSRAAPFRFPTQCPPPPVAGSALLDVNLDDDGRGSQASVVDVVEVTSARGGGGVPCRDNESWKSHASSAAHPLGQRQAPPPPRGDRVERALAFHQRTDEDGGGDGGSSSASSPLGARRTHAMPTLLGSTPTPYRDKHPRRRTTNTLLSLSPVSKTRRSHHTASLSVAPSVTAMVEVEIEPGMVAEVLIRPGDTAETLARSFIAAHNGLDGNDPAVHEVLTRFFQSHVPPPVERAGSNSGNKDWPATAAAARPRTPKADCRGFTFVPQSPLLDVKYNHAIAKPAPSEVLVTTAAAVLAQPSRRSRLTSARTAAVLTSTSTAVAGPPAARRTTSSFSFPTALRSASVVPASAAAGGGSIPAVQPVRQTRASRLLAGANAARQEALEHSKIKEAVAEFFDPYMVPVDVAQGVMTVGGRGGSGAAVGSHSHQQQQQQRDTLKRKPALASAGLTMRKKRAPQLTSAEREVTAHCTFKPTISNTSRRIFAHVLTSGTSPIAARVKPSPPNTAVCPSAAVAVVLDNGTPRRFRSTAPTPRRVAFDLSVGTPSPVPRAPHSDSPRIRIVQRGGGSPPLAPTLSDRPEMATPFLGR